MSVIPGAAFPVGALSLHGHLERLEALRRRVVGQKSKDAQQNRRLEALEREVLLLGAGLSGLYELLRELGIATSAQLDAALERATAAAEATAAQDAAQAAAAAAAKVKERRRRARRRARS